MYNNYISEIRNFRMHLEAHEEHLIRQIRTPLERDDLEQSVQRITEHEVHICYLKSFLKDKELPGVVFSINAFSTRHSPEENGGAE